ncbi:MAG TPA: hypothetical protein VK434_00155 [Microvirga sp.]|nr:hypothetical protein [Microvirga sp.]
MRSPVARIVPDLPVPDEAVLAEARQSGSSAEHGRFLGRIQAFQAIEGRPPPLGRPSCGFAPSTRSGSGTPPASGG